MDIFLFSRATHRCIACETYGYIKALTLFFVSCQNDCDRLNISLQKVSHLSNANYTIIIPYSLIAFLLLKLLYYWLRNQNYGRVLNFSHKSLTLYHH